MSVAEQLIAVWVDWEALSASPVTVNRKMDLLHQLGLDTCRVHDTIAAARRQQMSVPDAVQTVINDHPHLKEVS